MPKIVQTIPAPLIADVCFKDGFIGAWGRGTLKILQSFKEAGLPEPEIIEQDGGILVTLFKDRYNEAGLRKMGLNKRQVKAALYVSENGKITNKQYYDLYSVSRNTSSDHLRELTQLNIFKPSGAKGAGAFYTLYKQHCTIIAHIAYQLHSYCTKHYFWNVAL